MITTATAPPRTGYGAVLRIRGLLVVYVAHAVSMVGTVAAEVALSILIFERTHSALLSALVLVCSFLPYAVGGSVLSGIADRLPAREVLVVCDLISAVAIGAMLIPGLPVAGVLVLLLVAGTVAPVFQGARASSLAQLLDTDTFPVGRSLLRVISQAAVLSGFALGGVAVAIVGARWMLLADAASFVFSAGLLRFATPWTPANAPDGERSARAVLRESFAGLRLVRTDVVLRRLLVLSLLLPAFGSAVDGVVVAYTVEAGSAASSAGVLYTGFAAGLLLGEIAVSRLAPTTRRLLVVPLLALSQLPALAFVLVPSVPVAAVLLAVGGLGLAANHGLDPLLLAATPVESRGRLFTLQSSGLMSGQGLSIALAGLAATLVRPSVVVAVVGAIGLVVLLGFAHRALP